MNRKLRTEELNRPDISTYRAQEKIPLVVVLDNVRSMQNVGAFFRTADAFLIEKICLCGITAKPPHREIQKSALGATESVAWEYHEYITDCISTLQSSNYRIMAIEQTSENKWLESYDVNPQQKYAVVFGNEVSGVSDDVIALADDCIAIQQYGTKHSLNVSVCAGIVLWEFSKKLR